MALFSAIRQFFKSVGHMSHHARHQNTLYDKHQLLAFDNIIDWLEAYRSAIIHNLDRLLIITPITKVLIQKDETDDILNLLLDWRALGPPDELFSDSLLLAYLDAAGKADTAGLQASFNVTNTQAAEYALTQAAKLVTLIDEQTRDGLREIIADGLVDGKTIHQMAQQIRPLIGLNRPQMASASKYWDQLQEDEDPNAENKMNRYCNKQLRYRADMIARTETIGAIANGTLENYREMGFISYFFEASADACAECQDAEDEYPIEDAEVGVNLPTLHPLCRCSISPGQLSDSAEEQPDQADQDSQDQDDNDQVE